MELAKTAGAKRVVPLPVDFSLVVRRSLRHFDPALVIVAESEFWPNFIAGARRRGTSVVLINGKMAARQGDMVMTCNDPADMPMGTITAGSPTVIIGP